MKSLLIILSFAALVLFSCTGGEENVAIPSGIVPPDSMVGIFVDFHLVEAELRDLHQRNKDVPAYTGYYYSMIFKKHHITQQSYDKSLQFYSYHPRLLAEIYNKVISELSTGQSKSLQPDSETEANSTLRLSKDQKE